MHDGAQVPYGRKVTEYLDVCYTRTWIGQNGFALWPSRSFGLLLIGMLEIRGISLKRVYYSGGNYGIKYYYMLIIFVVLQIYSSEDTKSADLTCRIVYRVFYYIIGIYNLDGNWFVIS